MSIRIFIRQLGRGKGRALLSALLLCVVTAFFVMSLNLYRASAANLSLAEDTFSAYIPDQSVFRTEGGLLTNVDHIRFRIDSDQPIVLPILPPDYTSIRPAPLCRQR